MIEKRMLGPRELPYRSLLDLRLRVDNSGRSLLGTTDQQMHLGQRCCDMQRLPVSAVENHAWLIFTYSFDARISNALMVIMQSWVSTPLLRGHVLRQPSPRGGENVFLCQPWYILSHLVTAADN